MQTDPAGIVARRAKATVHHSKRVECLREHLTCRYLRRRLASEEIHLLRRMDLLGQTANRLSRNAADGFCPFGSLRFVVIGAQDVILEVVLSRSAFGHMLGIEPYAVRVEEFLIVQVVLDLVIHHADAQRRVGAGTHGHPLVSNRLHRLVQPRIDNDDLAALFTRIVELIRGVAALVRHPVVAEVEVQIGNG